MSENEINVITLDKIKQALWMIGQDPPEALDLKPLPFEGQWGVATSVAFQIAGSEYKSGKITKQDTRSRAAEIANELANTLIELGGFEKIEAINGYVNIHIDVSKFVQTTIQNVLAAGSEYGHGSDKGERVMVEYSQPNTHKGFHVGHLRNACLGSSLLKIMKFAGFDTIGANYIGDIGMHVIKCLWAYKKYHQGQEPATGRGVWLGQVYAEADSRLGFKDNAIKLLQQSIDFNNTFSSQVRGILDSKTKRKQVSRLTADQIWVALNPALDSLLESFSEKISLDSSTVKSAEESVREKATGKSLQFLGDLKALLKNKDKVEVGNNLKQLLDKELRKEALNLVVPELWNMLGTSLQTFPKDATQDKVESEYNELNMHFDWWKQVDGWDAEIKSLFHEWEMKEPYLMALWEKTREWSMDEFHEIYNMLDVEFDIWFYESQVEEEGKQIVDDMIAKGIAEDLRPEGPVLVKIDEQLRKRPDLLDDRERVELFKTDESGKFKELYRSNVILRSDGTSLYSTKDLSLAKRKFEDYGVDRSIYVVDVRQSMYFKQVFKILELWGFEQAKKCYHLAYEIVSLPEGTMSSRAGNIVLFANFAQEAFERAYQIVNKKNPDLDEKQKRNISRVVALGAIKYSMLNRDNNRVIVFNFDEALNYEGQAAPSIQYAHARATRVLEKGNIDKIEPTADLDYSYLNAKEKIGPEQIAEINLAFKIATFPSIVEKAAQEYKPVLICLYLFELAETFSNFYHRCGILRGDIPPLIRTARLSLTQATKQTLANGLHLLGIEAPEVM